jgi:hypothetical protein
METERNNNHNYLIIEKPKPEKKPERFMDLTEELKSADSKDGD